MERIQTKNELINNLIEVMNHMKDDDLKSDDFDDAKIWLFVSAYFRNIAFAALRDGYELHSIQTKDTDEQCLCSAKIRFKEIEKEIYDDINDITIEDYRVDYYPTKQLNGLVYNENIPYQFTRVFQILLNHIIECSGYTPPDRITQNT